MERILFEPDKLAACPNEHDEVVCEADLQEFVLRQTGKRNTYDPVNKTFTQVILPSGKQ